MAKMEVTELGKGLWRWTAPHPEWTPEKDKPGGWGQRVGCVTLEVSEGIVLIDPLAPPERSDDASRFWEALDRDVARIGKPVTILLGNSYHQRSAPMLLERYRVKPGARIFAPEKSLPRLTCEVAQTFQAGGKLPGNIVACGVRGLDCPGETVFYLPGHRALVPADALIGIGGGKIRVPPIAWAQNTPEGQEGYKREFRTSLRDLTKLDIEVILASHGEPVLKEGRAALAEALTAPAWGEE